MREQQSNVTPMPSRQPQAGGTYAGWLAVGAVVAGTVGAVVGAARTVSRHRHGNGRAMPSEAAHVTAPHGDKLGNR